MRVPMLTLLFLASTAGLLTGCSDTSPPTWPDGAELQIKDVTASSATLDWPPALDDDAVAGYRIYHGQEQIADVGSGAAFHELADLAEAQDLTFGIEPHDAAGNTGKRLEVTFRTADVTVPVWPEGAALAIEKTPVKTGIAEVNEDEPEEFTLAFTWPAAADNVAVTSYRVKKGNAALGEVDAKEELAFEIRTRAPDGLYAVEAGDAGGNWSEGLVRAEGSLSSALTDALGETGILKLLGDTSTSAPTLGIGGLNVGGKPAVPLDQLAPGKGLGGPGGAIAPGSLIGKDSKLKAPSGDLSLDLLQDKQAPTAE